jgi:hypothetical protein
MLTAERVREVLDYNEHTGQMTWRVRPHPKAGRVRAGDVAGSFDSHGRRRVKIDQVDYIFSRVVHLYMTGEWPPSGLEVDHINCDPKDNRWANLRLATRAQNEGNTRLRKNNTSGVKGVTWDRSKKKWQAQITINCKPCNLGRFDDINDAAEAYHKAAQKHFGSFARTS